MRSDRGQRDTEIRYGPTETMRSDMGHKNIEIRHGPQR